MCEGNKNRGQHTRAQKQARTTVEEKKKKQYRHNKKTNLSGTQR